MPPKQKPLKILQTLRRKYPKAKNHIAAKSRKPINVLVATILSAQVRDEVVDEVTKNLFRKYKTVKDYSKTNVEAILKYVRRVSYPGNKARNIIKASKAIMKDCKGRVPKTIEELMKLPGVGRKTANVIMQNAFGAVVGIPCDTHVLRLAYRLGWTKNKNPEKVEQDLKKIFSKAYWTKIPSILKAHGRAVCKAPTPICSKCPVKNLCPKKGVAKKL